MGLELILARFFRHIQSLKKSDTIQSSFCVTKVFQTIILSDALSVPSLEFLLVMDAWCWSLMQDHVICASLRPGFECFVVCPSHAFREVDLEGTVEQIAADLMSLLWHDSGRRFSEQTS